MKIKEYLDKPDLEYDRKKWLKEAIKFNKDEKKFEALETVNFLKTHYWQFQIAVQMQIAEVWHLMSRYAL